jgi:hypothetical protein
MLNGAGLKDDLVWAECAMTVTFLSNITSVPCLLSKWDHNKILIIGIYVDDCLVIGKET